MKTTACLCCRKTKLTVQHTKKKNQTFTHMSKSCTRNTAAASGTLRRQRVNAWCLKSIDLGAASVCAETPLSGVSDTEGVNGGMCSHGTTSWTPCPRQQYCHISSNQMTVIKLVLLQVRNDKLSGLMHRRTASWERE